MLGSLRFCRMQCMCLKELKMLLKRLEILPCEIHIHIYSNAYGNVIAAAVTIIPQEKTIC